ncbi:MAG: hypothetical protein R3330_19230, partial [Saprospiraceae bacterium]|nr:hypothetical protein [Saprospiraceae bacterium]
NVVDDPAVTVSAQNPTICVGDTTTITATVTGGTSAIAYQWQSSTDNATWFDVPGATSSVIEIPGTSADTTYYRVRITDTSAGCSDPISGSVTVIVVQDPVVTLSLNNPIVCVDGSAIITANVTGGLAVSYQWQSSTDDATWFDIAGETGSTLNAPTNVPGVTYYRVVITDNSAGCGDPVSSSVQVTVYPDPSINVTADNAEVCVGGSLTLTANLSGGSPSAAYQWEESSDNVSFAPISGATDTFYLPPTSSVGVMYYRVVITDVISGCGDPTSASVSVTVVDDPAVTIALNNALVCVGGSATLTATVTGGSSPSLQWEQSPDSTTWTPIGGATGSVFNVPTSTAGVVFY